jgi:uncharacterized damage-inducible protein DinB
MTADASNLSAWSKAVRQSSLKRLRIVPEARENWKPSAGAMSIAGIAQHLVDADMWLFKKLEDPSLHAMRGNGSPPNDVSHQQYLEILSDLERTGIQRVELIQGLTAKQFGRLVPDERFGGMVSIWWEIVRGNLDHEAHHRGQLAAYLRIAQIVTT